MGVLDEHRVINGQYGECWHEGQWCTNITGAEAVVDIGKEEIKRSGTRWVGHKSTSLTGTGTISGYKVTSEWVERIGQIAGDRNKPFITELILKLDDPQAWGAYRCRLKGVTFDTIPVISYDVGSLVEEELPFTYTGLDLLDTFNEN